MRTPISTFALLLGIGLLAGGVLATIDTGGKIRHWWVTNPQTASYLAQAWNGTHVGPFHGQLRQGPGAASHNLPWSWHVDPEANGHVIATFAPPGTGWPRKPSECERYLALYLNRGELFAPQPFTMVAFEDYR